jgi:transposase
MLREQGEGTSEITKFLGIHQNSVSAYIKRYNACGIDALLRDKTRKPGKEPISNKIKTEICRLACNEKPNDETHWSYGALAKRVGISHNSVKLILQEHGLKLRGQRAARRRLYEGTAS